MAKYKITGVPKLNKFVEGGDPGDNFYNYGGLRYKRSQYGQWFYWNPAYNGWHQVGFNNPSVNGTPVYADSELEKMHKEKNPAFEATTEKKEKDKQTAAAASTKRAAILNSPIISTQSKIDYISKNSPTIENPEQLKKLQTQKQLEDAKKAQEDYLKQQEELKRQEEEYLRLSNPNFYNSETTQNVARSSGVLLTKKEQDDFEAHKKDLAEKKAFLGRNYVTENYAALSSEEKNNVMYGIKGMTWDDADKLSTLVLNDIIDSGDRFSLEDDIKAQFPNATEDQIKKYKNYIFDARNKAKTQIFNTVGSGDMSKAWTPDRDQIKAYDPNTTIEMTGRMPKTAGEWMTRIGDVIANPLDAIHYGMSPTEEMPMNMYEYEKAKAALGYEDGADQNTVLGGIDFASWFTGAGAIAQGTKMLRSTGEAVDNFTEDPSWSGAGNAALHVGFNALALSPLRPFLKSPKGNVPTSSLPAMPVTPFNYSSYANKATVGLTNESTQGLLPTISKPHAVTESPLTTMTPAVEKRGTTRLLDTNISLYRQQPKGYTNPYTGPDDPRLIEYEGWGQIGNPDYQAPAIFPYSTVGKWWDSNASRMTNTGVSPNTQINLANNPQQEIEILKVDIPFSEASKFAASKNPEAAPWAKQDTEYILPDKYKEAAESTPFRERKPLNLDAALKDENIASLSVELTPEVESIFNSNPELGQVGNVSEYVDYLKQLYPNSSAQDILYHVTRANEIAAESGRPFYATQDKGWISELEEFKGKRRPVAMNIENPTVLDPSYEFTDKAADIRTNSFGSNLITPAEARQPGTDGVIGRDLFQSEGRNTYVSFEPNQVLPLGSKQDVEMFKQWKEGQTVSQAAPSVAEVAPEVKSIFESKPEIENIGSMDEYTQYIKETYPEHKMLFHGTQSEVPFDEFQPNILGIHTGTKEQAWWRLDDDAWFEGLTDASLIPEELKSQIFPVAVNPKEYIKGRDYLDAEMLVGDKTGKLTEEIYDELYTIKSAADDEMRKLAITFYYDGTLTKQQAKQLIKVNDISYVKDVTGKKGYYYENQGEVPGEMSYVSFDPSDVTKLGGKKDIEGFKQWKESKSTGVSQESISAQTKQIVNKSDNELVSNIINDVRERKIGLWQSPEGQKRLQEMIDNTPSLKGQTPETMIEGIAQMENLNNFYQTELKINQDLKNEADQLDIFYAEGKMSSNDYFDRAAQVDDMIKESDKYLDDTEALFQKAGFYSADANVVGIRPGAFKPGEIEKVTSHELGHFLGSFGSKKSGTTYLDEKLSGLKLIDDVSEQLTIPGLEVEGSGAYSFMGPGSGKDYLNRSLNYFLKGSSGTEKVPFVAEVREDMLQQGIIKSEYDDITVKMLKDHYKNYKNTRGEKYPLRIYDIIKDKPENFKIMSDVLNRLPMIAGAALAYDELINDENDSNVSEAGMGGIALFLGLLAKKPGAIKIPKKLRGIVRDFQKYGNQAVNLLRSTDIRYVNSQIKKLEKEYTQISNDLGYGVNEGLVQQQRNLSYITLQRGDKFRKFFKDRELKAEGVNTESPFANPFQLPKLEKEVINKKQTLDTYNKAGNAYRITPEGLESNKPSMFEGVTTTGEKTITDLSTGEKVIAEVRLPGAREEYKIVDGGLVKTYANINTPIISTKYVTALKNTRNDVEFKIPGAIVFGSSVLVTDAGMPHITGDIDVLISQSDYNKNVKDKFPFVQDYGPAKQHNIYPEHGQEGVLDFNIIHEDGKGNVIPFYNPLLPDKTPLEIELFRQFYPDKFQEASAKAATTGKPLEINMSSKEFMAGIDPQVKTVIDSYETSPFNKWGHYNANKEKHILRPDVLIAYGNPEVVSKGQEAYIKSIVGSKGSLGHQFSEQALGDVNKNIDALLTMDFKGDNVLQVAQDPKRMQLAINDYYINNTVFSREIGEADLPGGKYTPDIIKAALTEWFPGKGASFNGIGLNATQKGNPNHLLLTDNPIIGHRQLGLKLDTNDPVSYVNSIVRGTSGNYVFTSEEVKLIEDLIDKYIPEVKTQMKTDFKSRDILNFQPFQNFEKSKDFLNELSEQTGIRAIRKEDPYETYGAANAQYASLLGKFDDVADAMMYSLKEYHAAPKTFGERKRALEQKKQDSRGKTPNFQLETKKDFEKLYSILDGGIKTAEARVMQLTDQLSALNRYKENLIAKMGNKDDALLQQVQNQIREMQDRQMRIVGEIPKLKVKAKKLKKFYQIVGLGGLGVGIIAGGYTLQQNIDEENRKFIEEGIRQQKINIDKINKAQGSKVTKKTLNLLPKIASSYLINNPYATEWPSGEPIEFITESLIKTPKGLVKTEGQNGLRWENTYGKYEDGGEVGLEMKLTPEEIQDYLSRGYVIVEE